jgi:hypothetical protein
MDIDRVLSVIAVLVSIGTSILAFRKIYWEGKNEEVSTAEHYEGMAERTAERLDKEIEKNAKFRAELTELRSEVALLACLVKEYEAGIDLLIRQLEMNRIIPAWKPKKKVESS